MADLINVGTTAGDGTGDSLRSAFQKLNDAVANLTATIAAIPGADINAQILQWALAEAYVETDPTYDSNLWIASSPVEWPDGSSGTYTTTAKDSTLGIPISWTITHIDSGKTVTQPTITLNSNGQVTHQPALTIS
jgi:hypothetical protein